METALVATHPHIGAHLLGGTKLPFFQLAADVALAHHERYDGSGYPLQLRGLAIPHAARIVAVADAFDALTSDGMGHTALSDEAALVQMAAQRGRGFDPRIIDCLMAHSHDIIDMRNRVRRSHPAMEDLLDLGTVEGLT